MASSLTEIIWQFVSWVMTILASVIAPHDHGSDPFVLKVMEASTAREIVEIHGFSLKE